MLIVMSANSSEAQVVDVLPRLRIYLVAPGDLFTDHLARAEAWAVQRSYGFADELAGHRADSRSRRRSGSRIMFLHALPSLSGNFSRGNLATRFLSFDVHQVGGCNVCFGV